MDYKNLAKTILNLVGEEKNVASLTHCATRLRFNLKDESKADTATLKNTKGVMGAVSSGGQYQVIIGSDVGSCLLYTSIKRRFQIWTRGRSRRGRIYTGGKW